MLVASDPLGQESLRLAIVPIAISDGDSVCHRFLVATFF